MFVFTADIKKKKIMADQDNWRMVTRIKHHVCQDCGEKVNKSERYCIDCQGIFEEKRRLGICLKCDEHVSQPHHKFCYNCFEPAKRKSHKRTTQRNDQAQVCRICESNLAVRAFCDPCYENLNPCMTADCERRTLFKHCAACFKLVRLP